jgi:hypothetical protein
MELEYTLEDLKSLHDFTQKNPKLNIEDWFSQKYRKNLTEDERKSFEWIEMATIPIPDTNDNLYLLNWTGVGGGWFSEPFQVFCKKHFYKWHHIYTGPSRWCEMWLITPDDGVFDFESYPESQNVKDLKEKIFKIGDVTIQIYNNWDVTEENCRDYANYSDNLERYNHHFWTDNRWNVTIDKPDQLKYIKALDLF